MTKYRADQLDLLPFPIWEDKEGTSRQQWHLIFHTNQVIDVFTWRIALSTNLSTIVQQLDPKEMVVEFRCTVNPHLPEIIGSIGDFILRIHEELGPIRTIEKVDFHRWPFSEWYLRQQAEPDE